jgi:hypothetical protein
MKIKNFAILSVVCLAVGGSLVGCSQQLPSKSKCEPAFASMATMAETYAMVVGNIAGLDVYAVKINAEADKLDQIAGADDDKISKSIHYMAAQFRASMTAAQRFMSNTSFPGEDLGTQEARTQLSMTAFGDACDGK